MGKAEVQATRNSRGPLFSLPVRSIRRGFGIALRSGIGGVQMSLDLPKLGQIESCSYQRAESTAQQKYPHDEPEIHYLSTLPSVRAAGTLEVPKLPLDSNPSEDA